MFDQDGRQGEHLVAQPLRTRVAQALRQGVPLERCQHVVGEQVEAIPRRVNVDVVVVVVVVVDLDGDFYLEVGATVDAGSPDHLGQHRDDARKQLDATLVARRRDQLS